MEEVATSICIETAEKTVLFEYPPEALHYRHSAFFLNQTGIKDLACGIIKEDNQIILAALKKWYPLMCAAVTMYKHPPHGPTFSPFTMRSTLLLPGHQPGGLQCCLHPLIAQLDSMDLNELLVKVAHVVALILLPI
jgi:hypothetical protein